MPENASKIRPSTSRLSKYLRESQRPLASLAFTLPLLAAYEGGVLLLGTSAVRNGVDVWLRQLLDAFGLGSYFLLPALSVAILLGWHHTTHQPWNLSAGVLYGMLVESAALGIALLILAEFQATWTAALGGGAGLAASLHEKVTGLTAAVVSYFGAGIYEEMLFRLMLLPLAARLIALLGGKGRARTIGAVIITSSCFAAAHYVGPHGETFSYYSFSFRFVAGGFFAALFVYRGFGVAVGTHAFYDIFVGL